jgi:formylglycine-generating enzyme required for sulfatase activity
MHMPVNLLLALARAALNCAGLGPIAEVAEIAKAAWEDWKASPEERIEELEAIIRADDEEMDRRVVGVVAEVAGDAPASVREDLTTFLKQFPNRVRRSQRRPSDPSGRTICPGLALGRPEDLIPFLPERPSYFQAGDHPPGVGDRVLVELLGTGGFGEVWKARNAHIKSLAPVALKFCTDPQARERLLRHEATVLDRVMRQGRHPGIVQLQATYLRADPPCLQYEYVEGGDLSGLIRDWQRRTDGISPEKVARVILHLAEIMAFAHRLDPPIVHRDLKPANILLQRLQGGKVAVKITDFGIGGIAASKAIQAPRQATKPSQFLATAMRGSGTLLYASPEQLRGNPPDPRDDVHALGVLWYQMLAGDLTKGRPGGTAWRRRFLDHGMSSGLLELLESCFEDQEDRPADAAVLAKKLGALLKPPVDEVKKAYGPPRPEPVSVLSEPPKEIVNSIGMKLKLIPAGEFLMGSAESDDEKPRHKVTISRPLYLGVYPVTQGEYIQAMKTNPSGFSGHETHPVENVSWFDAVAFCNTLSRKGGLPPFYVIHDQSVEVPDWNGPGYRLPTEAEWEYACQAGATTRYSFGDGEKALDEYAWYSAESNRQTHPVGQKKPNAFGIHDMHGNIWEWCWDWYDPDFYKKSPAADPRGPEQATARVYRGGCWDYIPQLARSADRAWITPVYWSSNLGFRVVRSVLSGRRLSEPVGPYKMKSAASPPRPGRELHPLGLQSRLEAPSVAGSKQVPPSTDRPGSPSWMAPSTASTESTSVIGSRPGRLMR